MSGISPARDSGRGRTIRHGVAAALGGATLAMVLVTPATAAQPDQRACLGQDIRSYAQGGAQFGGFVAVLADGGVGVEIQAHLAGDIPDDVTPNSCND